TPRRDQAPAPCAPHAPDWHAATNHSQRLGTHRPGNHLITHRSILRPQRFRDLPVVTEWIKNPPDAPAMLVIDRCYSARSGRDCARKGRVWILHHHYHSASAATERLGAEVAVFRRFIRKPEFSVTDCEPSDDSAILTLDAKLLYSAKRSLVKLDRGRSV